MSPQFLGSATNVSGHGLRDRRQLCQPLSEHPTAADLLLRRFGLVQFKAWRASELPGRLFNHNAELLAECPGVSFGQVHGCADAHRLKVSGHTPTDAPHFLHLGIAQHPIALERIGDVDHAARLCLQTLGRMIGQLRERLRASNADAHRNSRALEDPRAQLSPELGQILLNAGEVSETLVDAVDLCCRHHGLNQCHDALAHVAVERIVAAEGHDAVSAQLVLRLEKWLAHLHKWLSVV